MLKPILVCLWILAAIVATSEETATVLEIAGDVETPLHLTAEDLKALPRGSARVTTSDGLEVSYEGVFLHDILRRAGVPLGEGLRGKALASYVLAEAEDGYQWSSPSRSWTPWSSKTTCSSPTARTGSLFPAATANCES